MIKLTSSYYQSSLLSLGTVFNSFLGLAFYLLVARSLGVSDFGYFSYLLGLGIMASEIGDFGINSALVKFGSKENFSSIYTLAFIQRTVISLIFVLLFLPFGFLYSALAAISLSFLSITTQGFIARGKYWQYAFVNIFGNSIRLLLVIWLIISGLVTPVSALIVFGLANFTAFIIGFLRLRSNFINILGAKEIFPSVFQYCRWLAVSFSLSSIAAKIDVPVIYFLGGAFVAGIYSSAQKLSSVFLQIAVSLENVFSPKFSQNLNYQQHFRDYFIVVFLAGISLVALILISPIIIPLFLGLKYVNAIGVFQIILLGLIPFFISGPFVAGILYRFGKSDYHLVINFGQLLFSLLGYYLLVPLMGGIGVAITVSVVNFMSLIGSFLVYWKLTKNEA